MLITRRTVRPISRRSPRCGSYIGGGGEKAGFTHWHKAHRGGTATFAMCPGPYGVGSAKRCGWEWS